MKFSDLLTQASVSAFLGAFAAVLLTEIVRLFRSRMLAKGVAESLGKELHYCFTLSRKHVKNPWYYLDANVTARYPVEFLQMAIQVFTETRWRNSNQIYALTRFLDEMKRLNSALDISLQAAVANSPRLNRAAARGFGEAVADTFRLRGAELSMFQYALRAAKGGKIKLDFLPLRDHSDPSPNPWAAR